MLSSSCVCNNFRGVILLKFLILNRYNWSNWHNNTNVTVVTLSSYLLLQWTSYGNAVFPLFVISRKSFRIFLPGHLSGKKFCVRKKLLSVNEAWRFLLRCTVASKARSALSNFMCPVPLLPTFVDIGRFFPDLFDQAKARKKWKKSGVLLRLKCYMPCHAHLTKIRFKWGRYLSAFSIPRLAVKLNNIAKCLIHHN